MVTGVWPNNVPAQLTSFVGRRRELEDAVGALAGTRLLVLTGSGGSGKTRLAMAVAAAAAPSFPGGGWWVDLAPVSRDEQVAGVLADVLGVRPLPGRTQTQAAVEHLAADCSLVVLDNCEHVPDGAADLAEALLRGCPRVVVLGTSRIPLRVPGESDWVVPPLSLPVADTAEEIARSDAGALFVERAVKVHPAFGLAGDNAVAVGRICREVDGLPLAIELAAARVRILAARQIAEGLRDRFALLIGGPRGAAARQQTLRASVDWSYDLLSEPERLLFRRLAVFVGGWSLEAVEAVCAGEGLPSRTILDLLTSLADKSLVVVERHGRLACYRLLETVRQYAFELLDGCGETAALTDRHLRYYEDLAQRAARGLKSPRVLEWIEALDQESANLAAAVDHALGHQPDAALRLTVALTGWWKLRGMFGTGQLALTRALAGTDPAPSALRARALWSCGFMARFAGDTDAARESSDQGLQMAEAIGDDWSLAMSLQSVASLRMMRGPSESQPLFARGLEHARRCGDAWVVLALRVNMAPAYLMNDDYAAAERVVAEAAAGCPGPEADSQVGLSAAWCAMARGRFEQALAICEQTASAAIELGDPVAHALADRVAAWVEMVQGKHEAALERMRACEARVTAKGAFIPLVTSRIEVAQALAALGRLDEARDLLEVVVAGGADSGWYLCRALLVLADVLRAAGDPLGSRDRASEALQLATRLRTRSQAAMARELLAQLRISCAAWGEAGRLLHEALALRVEIGSPVWMPQLLDGFAQVATGLESYQEGARLLGAADRARTDLGTTRWPLHAPAMAQTEQLLQDQLGQEGFTVAVSQGTAMPLEEAVGWVRRARGTRKRPSRGWESLTPTERKVVDLVVQGLSNSQIGERMFISRGTAKIHLGHIFEKLGMHSRSELAALAARRST